MAAGWKAIRRTKSLKAVNRDKNRVTPPAAGDIDATATLAKMLKIGDDTDRWDEDKGAEIVGEVFNVKPGGVETCNCKATEAEFTDTHIEIVPAVNKNDPTHRVIVEVTPRMRAKMGEQRVDWSTDTLKTWQLEDLAGDVLGGSPHHRDRGASGATVSTSRSHSFRVSERLQNGPLSSPPII